MLFKKSFLFLPLLGLISCAHQMPSNINLVEVYATARKQLRLIQLVMPLMIRQFGIMLKIH